MDDKLAKWLKERERLYDELEKQDRIIKQAGGIVGRYISEVECDGYAIYIITREYKTKVKIEHWPGSEDYYVPYWGEKATIDKSYAIDSLKSRDGLNELFGRT
jgi:hypothetical protein